MKLCRAPGCSRPAASRYAVYCAHHKARLRRHGAVDQDAITAADLGPCIARVGARIERNRDSPAWTTLERRWLDVVDHARSIVASYEAGRPMSRHELRAAHEITRVAADADPNVVVVTVLAMYVLLALEPRHFRSDAGFRFQLVRRVRALADAHSGITYDHAAGMSRRVYRELPPKAVVIIGHWLAEALGVAGIRLGSMELDDAARAERERRTLHQALEELR